MNGAIRQHKEMAMGKDIGGGSFGCESLASVNGGRVHDENVSHSPLADSERANPPPIPRGSGMMHATAHSNHGPHHLPS